MKQADDLRVIVLRDLKDDEAALVEGCLVHIDLHDTCANQGDYGAYGDLLKGCYAATQLSPAIDFVSYEYKATGEVRGNIEQFMLRLTGRVKDGQAAMTVLRHLRPLVAKNGAAGEIGELIDDLWQNEVLQLAADFDVRGIWDAPDRPLPKLFRATRIEQLLYWLQSDGTEDDRPDIVKEILTVDPSLAENPEFMRIAAPYISE